MRPDLQEAFLHRVTDDSYRTFCEGLEQWLGMKIEYRVCEMPVFVSRDTQLHLESSAIALIQQCLAPEALQASESTLSDRYRVRNESPLPLFSVVDFAITDQGPKLIELQGFPSLLGYQYLYAQQMIEAYGLPQATPLMSGARSSEEYVHLLRQAVYADADPAATFIMEIDPDHQKTRTDFIAMEKYVGVRTINLRDVRKHGRELHVTIDGRIQKIERVLNRAIIDELDDLGVQPHFAWSDDLDVQWAGHPNWYFRISKASMPFLHHPSVPTTTVVADIASLPTDLSGYVLKPLYSFAGKGVNVSPTLADIEAIPEHERSQWILQEKVEYAPCVITPHGMNKVEIRVMLLWFPNTPSPIPVMAMARTGRHAMMGARYNVDPWTGSSGCVFEG